MSPAKFIRRNTGLGLRERFPPDTVVALNAAGIIAYYSRLPTIDMLGLNDRHIARHGRRDRSLRLGHQAGDGAYVLTLRPDLIQFGPSWGEARPMFIGDRELHRSPEFQRRYTLATYVMPSGRKVRFYRLKEPSAAGRRSGGT